MPDALLAERPLAAKAVAPGDWPKFTYPANRVKASIVVLGEFRTPEDEARIKTAIEAAVGGLDRSEGIQATVNFDQV